MWYLLWAPCSRLYIYIYMYAFYIWLMETRMRYRCGHTMCVAMKYWCVEPHDNEKASKIVCWECQKWPRNYVGGCGLVRQFSFCYRRTFFYSYSCFFFWCSFCSATIIQMSVILRFNIKHVPFHDYSWRSAKQYSVTACTYFNLSKSAII